jgi:flagellar protein FlaG
MNVEGIAAANRLTAPTVEPKTPDLTANREVIRAVHAVNQAELFGQGSELTFLMDRKTHRPLIRVVDRQTGEVIQQIPPEHVLQLAESLANIADIDPLEQEEEGQ